MHSVVRIVLATLALGFAAAAAPAQSPVAYESTGAPRPLLAEPARLHVKDVPLAAALEGLTEASRVPMAFSPSILGRDGLVSCACRSVSVGEALDRILHGTSFRYAEVSGVVVITPGDEHRTDPERPAADAGGTRLASTLLQPGALPANPGIRPSNGIIAGVVVNESTLAPVQAAEVAVIATGQRVTTDARGRFRIEGLDAGTVELRVSRIGFQTRQVTARVGDLDLRILLEESAIPLDGLIVTGTMIPTQLRSVPTPVGVITAAEIQQQGITRAEDILRTVAGVGVVTSTDASFHSRIFSRGPTSLTSGFSGMKVYVDGIELANPQWTLNQIDPASIERMEIVRGPQASTLYGSEAIAGVIQIFTKKGTGLFDGRPRIEAQVAAGGLESPHRDGLAVVQDHRVNMSGGDDRISYNLGGTFRSTGEWVEDDRRASGMPRNSAHQNAGVFGGLRYTAGTVTAEANVRAFRGTYGVPHPPEVVDRVRSGRWNEAPLMEFTKANGLEQRLDQQTYGLTVRWAATPRWQHHATFGFDRSVAELARPTARLITPADTFLYYSRGDEGKTSFTYHTALQLSLGGSVDATIQTGIDTWTYRDARVTAPNAVRLDGDLGSQVATITRTRVSNHGLFAQGQFDWRDRLFLTLGARADDNSAFGEDYGYAVAPRVGLAHVAEFGDVAIKSRFAWGEAIRPPTPTQRTGNPSTPSTTYLPNESLGPESQKGFDVGAEIFVTDRYSFAVTYYDQKASDLISLVRLNPIEAAPAEVQYQNVGRIRNQGWEFEGTARFGALRIAAQYSPMNSTVEKLSPTYTGADFVEGERPPIAPSSTARLSLGYTGTRLGATVGVNRTGTCRAFEFLRLYEALYGTDPDREPFTGNPADYRAEFSPLYRVELAGWWTVNDRLDAFLNVDNLLNDHGKELSDINPVRGRQAVFGLRWSY